jgi:hypothetical protein
VLPLGGDVSRCISAHAVWLERAPSRPSPAAPCACAPVTDTAGVQPSARPAFGVLNSSRTKGRCAGAHSTSGCRAATENVEGAPLAVRMLLHALARLYGTPAAHPRRAAPRDPRHDSHGACRPDLARRARLHASRHRTAPTCGRLTSDGSIAGGLSRRTLTPIPPAPRVRILGPHASNLWCDARVVRSAFCAAGLLLRPPRPWHRLCLGLAAEKATDGAGDSGESNGLCQRLSGISGAAMPDGKEVRGWAELLVMIGPAVAVETNQARRINAGSAQLTGGCGFRDGAAEPSCD